MPKEGKTENILTIFGTIVSVVLFIAIFCYEIFITKERVEIEYAYIYIYNQYISNFSYRKMQSILQILFIYLSPTALSLIVSNKKMKICNIIISSMFILTILLKLYLERGEYYVTIERVNELDIVGVTVEAYCLISGIAVLLIAIAKIYSALIKKIGGDHV